MCLDFPLLRLTSAPFIPDLGTHDPSAEPGRTDCINVRKYLLEQYLLVSRLLVQSLPEKRSGVYSGTGWVEQGGICGLWTGVDLGKASQSCDCQAGELWGSTRCTPGKVIKAGIVLCICAPEMSESFHRALCGEWLTVGFLFLHCVFTSQLWFGYNGSSLNADVGMTLYFFLPVNDKTSFLLDQW